MNVDKTTFLNTISAEKATKEHCLGSSIIFNRSNNSCCLMYMFYWEQESTVDDLH